MPRKMSRQRAMLLAYRLASFVIQAGWEVQIQQSRRSCSVYVTARKGSRVERTRISDHPQRRRGPRWETVFTGDQVLARGKAIASMEVVQ